MASKKGSLCTYSSRYRKAVMCFSTRVFISARRATETRTYVKIFSGTRVPQRHASTRVPGRQRGNTRRVGSGPASKNWRVRGYPFVAGTLRGQSIIFTLTRKHHWFNQHRHRYGSASMECRMMDRVRARNKLYRGHHVRSYHNGCLVLV